MFNRNWTFQTTIIRMYHWIWHGDGSIHPHVHALIDTHTHTYTYICMCVRDRERIPRLQRAALFAMRKAEEQNTFPRSVLWLWHSECRQSISFIRQSVKARLTTRNLKIAIRRTCIYYTAGNTYTNQREWTCMMARNSIEGGLVSKGARWIHLHYFAIVLFSIKR